jgi:transposase
MSRAITQPLRPLTETERQELQRVSRAPCETVSRHQRAIALLAVADGMSLIAAARMAGWRVHDTVTRLLRRFNERGLSALDDLPRSGRPRTYGASERDRIEREFLREPSRKEDSTATWSLSPRRRALRDAPDGLPHVSTFTILYVLHEAGYSWQRSRTWCRTGMTLRKRKDGVVQESYDPDTPAKKTVIERAYLIGERLGLPVWCEDEAGPYQTIPQPGPSFQPRGQPVRQDHQDIRGIPVKLLTLFRPATGELRAEPVEHTTNAVLHPWLKTHLSTILEQCPPPPELVPEGRRGPDWDIYPAADQLDRFFPPVRMLLIWDHLAGHKSPSLTQCCAEHGILLLLGPDDGFNRLLYILFRPLVSLIDLKDSASLYLIILLLEVRMLLSLTKPIFLLR